MSFFHNSTSRTAQSPIVRKLSRKKPPSGNDGGQGDDEGSSSRGSSQPASPSASTSQVNVASQQQQQQQGAPGVRENPDFQPDNVDPGVGAFEQGQAQHDIDSKKDYELCKEQVEQGHDRNKVLEHFKLVKDLKPLDAPATLEEEIDKK